MVGYLNGALGHRICKCVESWCQSFLKILFHWYAVAQKTAKHTLKRILGVSKVRTGVNLSSGVFLGRAFCGAIRLRSNEYFLEPITEITTTQTLGVFKLSNVAEE